MTQRITLNGPETSTIIETSDAFLFNKFLDWLKAYNPSKQFDLNSYPIKSESRLSACRVKAKKLNLNVIK